IFGGGCAGLWLLDELRRRGMRAVLLESGELGSGQTVAARGILHGGLKYQLQGMATAAARKVSDMPAVWRACLAGLAEPDLSRVTLRDRACCLWRTDSLRSRAGMFGAHLGLKVKPRLLADDERPLPLAQAPGRVYRLDEQVIDTASLVRVLAGRNAGRILKIDASGVQFQFQYEGRVAAVRLQCPESFRTLTLTASRVVFTAGAGNGPLRGLAGLPDSRMQLRPLHMAVVRGELPWLNGHCVDGAKTRVTITSDRDPSGQVAWQLGGQLAEEGVPLSAEELIARGQRELAAVLPGWQLGDCEWSTYRVDRAEGRTAGGTRPDDVQLLAEGNIITAWPTKLVLAPRLAERVLDLIPPLPTALKNDHGADGFRDELAACGWPAPAFALPPWYRTATWHRQTSPIWRKTA
ncbi:MAG: FAD-dependent oxidoreductase, partial [Pirellulales bacterium]